MRKRGFARFLPLAPVLAALTSIAPIGAAESEDEDAKVAFVVSYTLVEKRAPPALNTVRTHWSQTIRLSRDKSVGVASAMNGNKFGELKTALGQTTDGVFVNGLHFRSDVRIVDGAIAISIEYPTYVVRTTIKSNGRKSCTATKSFDLKPGSQFYETADVFGAHGPLTNSAQYAEKVTCAVVAGDDSASPAEATEKVTTIDVNYDSVMDQVRPQIKTGVAAHRSFEVSLSTTGKIVESGRLGDPVNEQRLGRDDADVSWRVASANKLIRIQRNPQSIRTIAITILPGNSCQSEAVEQLKPGFSEYMFVGGANHELRYYSRYQITNASCSIR